MRYKNKIPDDALPEREVETPGANIGQKIYNQIMISLFAHNIIKKDLFVKRNFTFI